LEGQFFNGFKKLLVWFDEPENVHSYPINFKVEKMNYGHGMKT